MAGHSRASASRPTHPLLAGLGSRGGLPLLRGRLQDDGLLARALRLGRARGLPGAASTSGLGTAGPSGLGVRSALGSGAGKVLALLGRRGGLLLGGLGLQAGRVSSSSKGPRQCTGGSKLLSCRSSGHAQRAQRCRQRAPISLSSCTSGWPCSSLSISGSMLHWTQTACLGGQAGMPHLLLGRGGRRSLCLAGLRLGLAGVWLACACAPLPLQRDLRLLLGQNLLRR